ncbi:ParB/RepB/Spo0J family partition protein [Patescibacteria group bacterium]
MRSALGKGLQSLIPNKSSKNDTIKTQSGLRDLAKLKKESVFNIEIDKIRPNPNQPRKEMSKIQLDELANSIKEYGILQPVIVTKIEKKTDRGRDVEYELVAGERRWRAAQIARIPRIPVIIKDNTKQVKFEMALVENVQRENLNPIEKALAYKRLHEDFGLSHEEIAQKIGKKRPTVSNAIRVLSLPPVAQKALADGRIGDRHARAILAVSPEKRMNFFKRVLKHNWSDIEVEAQARAIAEVRHDNKQAGPKRLFFRELEGKVKSATGYSVSITQRGDFGRLAIQFNNQKELDKIVKYLLKF